MRLPAPPGPPDMRVIVSGASGLIGTALRRVLEAGGHAVVGITRDARPGWVRWDPAAGVLEPRTLDGADAIVHLAGRSLVTRWTPRARRVMWASRVDSGRMLAEAAARLERPPAVFVTGSAVGYYGDRGNEPLDEQSAPGSDFLAELCVAWEAATEPAARAGARVAAMRTGVVLESLTARLALPFRLGLGARLGDGRQWLSWILLEDLARLYVHVLEHDAIHGPVNAVAPEPVTNAGFTRALAAAVHRPAFLFAPAFALRAMLGRDMADQTLLASQRAMPVRALGGGFQFVSARIEEALPRALGEGGR